MEYKINHNNHEFVGFVEKITRVVTGGLGYNKDGERIFGNECYYEVDFFDTKLKCRVEFCIKNLSEIKEV